MHHRLWDSIDQLTDDQFSAPVDYSIGSIRNHMVHLVSVDQRWLARLLGVTPPDHLAYEDFSTRAEVRQRWDQVEGHVRAFVQQLTFDRLHAPVRFEISRAPHPVTLPAWQILVQVVMHGTDHRAQILPLLARYGAPTFEQDYILWLLNNLPA